MDLYGFISYFRRKHIETLGCIAEMLDYFLPLVPWIFLTKTRAAFGPQPEAGIVWATLAGEVSPSV